MSQYLPEKNFSWDDEFTTDKDMNTIKEKIMNLKDDASTGYIFDVNLEYPCFIS